MRPTALSDTDRDRAETLLAGVRRVLFDMDGTLVDSGPTMAPAVNAIRARLELEPLPVPEVAAALGGGLRALLQATLPTEHHARIDEMRPLFHEIHGRHLLEARPFPGADRLVRRFGAHIGLVTNAPRRYAGPLVAHLGWRFAVICDGDGPRKPDPTPLRIAAERLGSPPVETLYVGDSDIDARAAKAAGMRFATVPWSRLRGPRVDFPLLFDALSRWTA